MVVGTRHSEIVKCGRVDVSPRGPWCVCWGSTCHSKRNGGLCVRASSVVRRGRVVSRCLYGVVCTRGALASHPTQSPHPTAAAIPAGTCECGPRKPRVAAAERRMSPHIPHIGHVHTPDIAHTCASSTA
eukprot:360056-Chlamydomonas_euryale.AAC.21